VGVFPRAWRVRCSGNRPDSATIAGYEAGQTRQKRTMFLRKWEENKKCCGKSDSKELK
jgi:hypothetical protein